MGRRQIEKGPSKKTQRDRARTPDLKTGTPTRQRKDSISCVRRLKENAKDGRERPNSAIDFNSWY